jgi:hypothetical protein
MIRELYTIKQTIASLKTNPGQIRCPSTNREAVAILIRAKPNQQSVFCVKCLVERSDELAKVKKDLLLLEDFLKNIDDQVTLLENKKDTISEKEANEMLDRVMLNLKNSLIQQIETAFDQSLIVIPAELKTYISLITSEAMQNEPEVDKVEKAQQEMPTTAPHQLKEAMLFYTLNMVDRKMLLKETLSDAQKTCLTKETKEQVNLLVERVLKTAANTILYENKFIRKFNPESDIIRRMNNIQPVYQYSMNGNLSLSFKVDHPAIFYGFSNYQATENFRVRYTISVGESKNMNNVLLEFESTLRTANDAIELSQQQTERTSAELFELPLVLEPEVWYNISMNPIEQRNIMMYWATATNQQGMPDQGFKLQSGKEVRFKGGLDDNCGNSTYAHIYADFYIV